MRRKILVTGFRAITALLLLLSFFLVIVIHISDKGDLIDRNTNWIILAFFIATGVFIWSLYISDAPQEKIHTQKSTEELMNEIKRSNLDKIRKRDKQNM